MRAGGEHHAAVAPNDLWRALSEPRTLGEALPNVDLVEVEGPDRFSAFARFATAVGITPLRMELAVSERREGQHVRITGRGRGGDNAVEVDVEVDLAAADSGSTVRWTANVHVHGPLRSLGQRALPGLVSEQLDAVLAAAEGQAAGGAATRREDAVAGGGAGQEEVADRERYNGGGV